MGDNRTRVFLLPIVTPEAIELDPADLNKKKNSSLIFKKNFNFMSC